MIANQEFDLSGLPPPAVFEEGIRRAPRRELTLTEAEVNLAVRNALRYIPPEHHPVLIPEFLDELHETGRIYGYRYRPPGRLRGRPLDEYQGRCIEGRAFQVMIQNNLDFDVALYPYELVTYGETGQVFQNWMQYRLTMAMLEQLDQQHTLVLLSGHPLGVFPSRPEAPRVITTNALMVGLYDDQENWHRAAALGVANYGQMTAGGWMYIGPQGIVHGTYNTLIIAGRKQLGLGPGENLAGRLFVSSGLGGMSGAQARAAEIAGAVAIIAEVDPSRIHTRHSQGWVGEVTDDAAKALQLAAAARDGRRPLSVAYHGNIVDLLQVLADEQVQVDLLSDQTSCHAARDGGYCPAGIDFAERTRLLATDKPAFVRLVDASLKRHFKLIKTLTGRGTYFFDYGNAFMKAVFDAGVTEIARGGDDRAGFIWPSYVEDLLGPELFDFGYGPFRWVCLSGRDEDLERTDRAAAETIRTLRTPLRYQDEDNLHWVEQAGSYHLVVGTRARILYQDAAGRRAIALRFNAMVRAGETGPIMLGRDHHDTGGTDSPFRETANIRDGSNIMADMATQVFAGNAARGMSLVALHNGGGVGIGKAINGGFGMVLDGSERVDRILGTAMPWDVMGGVARRAWARNPNAITAAEEYNAGGEGRVLLPHPADREAISRAMAERRPAGRS